MDPALADVTSLGKMGESPIDIGVASLPEAVDIATHKNATFLVSLVDDRTDPALAARLLSDCGPGSAKTTKVGVNITKATVSIWKKQLSLNDLGIAFNATIPCPSVLDGEIKASAAR